MNSKLTHILFASLIAVLSSCSSNKRTNRPEDEKSIYGIIFATDILPDSIYANDISIIRLGNSDSYDWIYDSLFYKVWGAEHIGRIPTTDQDMDNLEHYLTWRDSHAVWDSLNVSNNDTIYIYLKDFISSDGEISNYAIFKNNHRTLLSDSYGHNAASCKKTVSITELTPGEEDIMVDTWGRGTSHKKYLTESKEIFGGNRSKTHAARIIINGNNVSIDTISYGEWENPDIYKDALVSMTELSDTHLRVYDILFDKYLKFSTSPRNKQKVATNFNKHDFGRLWEKLKIQQIDTVFVSVLTFQKEGNAFNFAILQSRNENILASVVYENDINPNEKIRYGFNYLKHGKRYSWHEAEVWDTSYYDYYKKHMSVSPNLPTPQIYRGKDSCFVNVVRIIFDGDKYQLERKSYNARRSLDNLLSRLYPEIYD